MLMGVISNHRFERMARHLTAEVAGSVLGPIA